VLFDDMHSINIYPVDYVMHEDKNFLSKNCVVVSSRCDESDDDKSDDSGIHGQSTNMKTPHDTSRAS